MKRSLLILLFALTALSARALEVKEVIWGFDGQVVPGRVNLLSVLLDNPSNSAFDGAVVFYKTQGLGQRMGEKFIVPCYLSPGVSRWVQFYPHVNNEQQWVMEWGSRAQERYNFRFPSLGPPARVLLFDRESSFARAPAIRAFPDNLFPVTVAATDGLDSVVMDYAPKWEAPKREAFLDWLRRGGTVHLLMGTSGQFPEFSGDLSALNSPLDRFRVGSGLVVRHAVGRREVNDRFLAEKGFPAPELQRGKNAYYNLEMGVFQRLVGMTRPDFNWPLIYLVAALYLAAIGPANWLLGKKVRDYRFAILFFLGAVALFAFAFNFIGRRGYGETTTIHALAYARPAGGGSYDVAQWINAFVTRGAYYTISHDSSHNLYATCQDYEAVNGVTQNGKDGAFGVDIPIYSFRTFLHRGKLKGPDLGVRFLSMKGGAQLNKLSLAVGPGFPTDCLQIRALWDGKFYPMRRDQQQLELASGAGETVETALSPQALSGVYNGGGYRRGFFYGGSGKTESDESAFQSMIAPLLNYAVGGGEALPYRWTSGRRADDRVQLFVFARSPESFRIKDARFKKQVGFVLYHIDVFPESELSAQ